MTEDELPIPAARDSHETMALLGLGMTGRGIGRFVDRRHAADSFCGQLRIPGWSKYLLCVLLRSIGRHRVSPTKCRERLHEHQQGPPDHSGDHFSGDSARGVLPAYDAVDGSPTGT